jgi:hypothetical protein
MTERTKSALTYCVLVGVILAATVAVRFTDAGEVAESFLWPIVIGVAIAGAIGVALTRRAGLPEMWERSVDLRSRLLFPGIVGAAFGLITIAHAALSDGDGDVTPFPASLLVFAAGGVLVETLLRLFAITTITAIAASIRPSWQSTAFWIAAVVASLYEPLPFIIEAVQSAHPLSAVLVATRLFVFNLFAAYFYRRGGFMAAMNGRWADYLVWHIIGQNFLGLR